MFASGYGYGFGICAPLYDEGPEQFSGTYCINIIPTFVGEQQPDNYLENMYLSSTNASNYIISDKQGIVSLIS
jgi:hypothetical protein